MSDYFYINRQFDDFDELAATARLWNVQMTQLSCGKSINTLKQLSLEKAKLNQIIFNGHKTTVGDPPPGRTFAFYSGKNSELIWRNKKVLPNNILIFPCGAEHDVMTNGKNIHVHTITVPETVWSSSLSSREADSYHKQLSPHEIVNLSPYEMSKLKQLCFSYFKRLETSSNILDGESFRRRAEEQLLFAIKRALFSITNGCPSPSSRKTTLNAWGTIDAILKKPDEPCLSVNGLCLATGVSERSLRRLFMERFGISPKKYLTAIRLNRVRRDLKKSSSSQTKIADVANNWGFWHMGQFAADYKKLFGELPSTTLGT